jgi:hypothetical protein
MTRQRNRHRQLAVLLGRRSPATRCTLPLDLSLTLSSEAERSSWLAEKDDDVDKVIESTQAADARTETLFHYGDLPSKVVGVRFYEGYVSAGEQLLLNRESGNPYDGKILLGIIPMPRVWSDLHILRQLALRCA